jgi:rod shape determining protein RodA
MVSRRNNVFANLDWMAIFLYFILISWGVINIFSAEFNETTQNFFDFSLRSGKQMIWIGAALILALLILIIDSRFYIYFANPLYIIMILALLAVLVVGVEINGSKSWFVIGPVRIQPSEFTKVVTSLALAKYLSSPNIKLSRVKDLVIPLAIIFLPAMIILLQPDTGSTLVYFSLIIVLYREGLPGIYVAIGLALAVLFIVTLLFDKLIIVSSLIFLGFAIYFFLERKKKNFFIGLGLFLITGGLVMGINQVLPEKFSIYYLLLITLLISGTIFFVLTLIHKLKYIILLLIIMVGAVGFTYSVDYVFHNILEDHQQKRINVVLGIESDPLGSGYNVNQSKIAIGSGGFSGKGYLRGTQTKFNFVPEQSTDFIFCTVGEEWGFLGTSGLILVFVILLLRLILLAERQKTAFNRIYGYAVFSIILFHFTINIGMTIGLVPVIGIPLPFISYGGSSLWAFTILLFIFLRLDASRNEFL